MSNFDYKILFFISISFFFWQHSDAQNRTSTSANTYFKPLKYRNIGPFRGGRSNTASGVLGDPLTYYMGTTGGGLWKTTDAGQHWENISDDYFQTGSVGAVAVSKSNPNIIYCGMGEHAVRGVMTHHGDGVYKSLDAGKTWQKMGLEATQHIARIQIHPTNPDIVYVAAQGALYSSSQERGIYKSSDGGLTWEKILFVDQKTGCTELAMDTNYPNVLYAAMWEHQRLPWKVISGGPSSGLYKSVDAGKTWKKIHQGLPSEKGKMAISVCASNPNKVYALVESDSNQDKGGLFVSNNGGNNWQIVSKDNRLTQRAWYYTEVFADPQNENMVYVLSAHCLRSIDGGKHWERIVGTHGDYHDLWINPDNPKNLCIANDGGAAISFNRGATWSRQDNMPTAQFYRVTVDNTFPYRIYGGQQDNTSISIQHRSMMSGGISPQHWTYSAGGESAFLAFDPDNPEIVLGGSYLGTIEALNTTAEAGTNIMSAPIQYLGEAASEMKYRYNWNAPIIWSQHEPNTYYHAAQFLLKTTDLGKTWQEVSPDLTKNDKSKQIKGGGPYTVEAVGAENYGTISYVQESPHEAGIIWVGSDDGLVHLTKDNGENWQNVTPNSLKECLINSIDVSPHNPATAYLATTRYKFNDHQPGLYKTTDYGKTWQNISSNLPQNAFTRVVREDENTPNLLYAGTELGMFISWDGGANWESFQLNLPLTPITDLIQKHDDLIIATSGRSFWILDDLEVIREYKDKDEASKLHLFPADTAILANGYSELNASNPKFDGSHPMRGVNPANGVVIYYHLKDHEKDEILILKISDKSGNIIREFTSKEDPNFKDYAGGPSPEPTLTTKEGLNRFVWNMRHATLLGAPTAYIEGAYGGHKVAPGHYRMTLISGDKTSSQTISILANPLYPIDNTDYQTYDKVMTEMENNFNEMHQLVNQLWKVKSKLEIILKELPKDQDDLKEAGTALLKKIKQWDEEMIQRKSKAYDDVENFPNKFTANYLFLINQTESDIPRVNQASLDRRKELDAEWSILKAQASNLIEKEIPVFNQHLWAAGIGAL